MPVENRPADAPTPAAASGALSFVKLRIISPFVHRMRFFKFHLMKLASGAKNTVDTPSGPVTYYAPNAKSFMRAKTVFSKEPETISWIDGFGSADTLWDIGANIGIYTIYAAAKPAAKVLAFEPSPSNFAVLCRSVELNRMDDRVSAYCLALDDRKQLSRFNMRTSEAGFAGSAFNVSHNHDGVAFEPSFRQAAIGYTIDAFIEEFDPPFPNHLKIDVDGNDHLVLAGAAKTLADPRLKSVLIELLGGERSTKGEQLLTKSGLLLDPDSEKARGNRIYRRAAANSDAAKKTRAA